MIIPTNKIIVILYLVVFALTIPAQAANLSKFEATCLDIGFKKKTEALSDCILELMLRAKRANSELQAAQQKAYDQGQQYKREAEARAIERNNQELARQQIQAQQYQQARQQQEPSYAETLIKVLFVGALGIGQGVSQGLQQQSAPSFQPIIQSAPSSVQPIQNVESVRCRTRMSISGSSANTTCEK
jgi:hypothetical protein